MKKITLMVSNLCTLGGTERVTSILSHELSEKFIVNIITNFQDNNIAYNIDENVEIINLYNKKYRLRKTLLDSILRIKDYINRNKIDFLIVVGRNNGIIPLFIRIITNTKLIYCEHNSINNYKFYDMTFKQKLYRYILQLLIIKVSDIIVVLTNKEKGIYIDKYNLNGEKVIVIPNFLDEKLLKEKNEYDINSKKIITVGRIDYQKGFEYLIEVAEKVFAIHSNWQWHIYGDGDKKYKSEIENSIKDKGLENKIILMGNKKNIYEIYQGYSFLVMTSRYEGLPMTLLEAKAKKLPLVSFDIESGPSDIIRNNIDGFLVKPFDIDEMSNKICELIEKPELRRKFSDNAQGNLDKFSKEKIMKQWYDLIESVE